MSIILALAAQAAGQQITTFHASPPGQTQVAVPASTPVIAPITVQPTTSAILRTGTEVPLRLSEQLTTAGKKLRVGQRFHMETSEPVMVQGVTVIPPGTPAMGEITDARNKGMWGKSGHLAARILYLTVNGRQIRLSGAFDDKGVAGGVGAALVSGLIFLPAGFFMTGTSAVVPAGAIVKGFIDEDVPLNIASAPVAPMTVGAPAEPLRVLSVTQPGQAPVTNVPPKGQ